MKPPRQITEPVPPGSARSGVAAAPAYAVLHVADFPLHALRRLDATLVGQPVALLESDRKRATVLACSAEARAQGAEPGLTAPQAQARCPDLMVRTRQPAAEADAQSAVIAAASLLSPLVEATAPGVATADVTALPPAQREPLLRAALTQLHRLGLPATGGLAATPLLALYAARLDPAPNPTMIAAGAPVYHVVNDARAFLAPLPLSVAEPPPELAPILAGWGLHTLGDLTALPKADVVQRLGPAGLALWERAAGETRRPLHPVTPPQTFTAGLELEHPVETLEPLLFLLRRFLDRLTLELKTAGWVAAELHLTLPLEDEKRHTRSFRLPEPTADPEVLFRTLHSHLETVHTDAAVTAVQLQLDPVRPLARQQGLFDTGLRDPHGFAETLARTVAVVGSGRVGTPRCEDTHRPDAVSLTPPSSTIPPAAAPDVLPPLGLPLRRFRPPCPARVELAGGAVQPSAGAPTFLWTGALHGTVLAVRGPWRGSGDWWQRDLSWEREEWDVALAGGGLYRVVRTPQGWWVEGEYD